MRVLQVASVAGIVGALVVGLVFASIPYSETVRWLVSAAVWVFGTAALLLGAARIQSLPSTLRPLACLALSGWTMACLAVATIASFWFAFLLLSTGEHYRTPLEWIWCRAILSGFFLACIVSHLVLGFVERGGRLTVKPIVQR